MTFVTRPDDRVSKRLIVRELHPHFGAEISGVDFSEPLDDQTTIELLVAIAKVSRFLNKHRSSVLHTNTRFLQYGVLVARGTALDDAKHIALGRTFGELDDIKPYISAGRPMRLQHDELFDVSNIELDGSLLDPGSARAAANKVRLGQRHSTQAIPFLLVHIGRYCTG
jgi:alpha-ketoglutarate-dependent 2,4-dichlorophenoxyacetate dioxygenase